MKNPTRKSEAPTSLSGLGAPYVVVTNSAAAAMGAGLFTADPLFVSTADFHLQSKGGHWDAASRKWVRDRQMSPCLDAGDPASPYENEFFPHGRRINLGAYGGTPEASLSLLHGTVLLLR